MGGAGLLEALFGEEVGGLGGGDVIVGGLFQDALDGVVDSLGLLAGEGFVVVHADFAGSVDDAAGVDDVVGGVEDAASDEGFGVVGGVQLVVGAAGDDAALEAGNGVGVEDAAEGVGGEDVAVDVVDFVGGDGAGAEGFGSLEGVGEDVGDDEVAPSSRR